MVGFVCSLNLFINFVEPLSCFFPALISADSIRVQFIVNKPTDLIGENWNISAMIEWSPPTIDGE